MEGDFFVHHLTINHDARLANVALERPFVIVALINHHSVFFDRSFAEPLELRTAPTFSDGLAVALIWTRGECILVHDIDEGGVLHLGAIRLLLRHSHRHLRLRGRRHL